jgi:hypothetical protein
MVVAGIVIFNILKLILEMVPNYPIVSKTTIYKVMPHGAKNACYLVYLCTYIECAEL